MNLPRPTILLSILEEHFLELDLLWERREHGVFDAEWNLADLAEIERRAGRHLRGLVVGQGHAADLALAALETGEASAAMAASFVLLELGDEALRRGLLERFASDPKLAPGIARALRHRPVSESEEFLRALPDSADLLVRACAVDVLSFHRASPMPGVRALLDAEDAAVRERAIAALGRWRDTWEIADLRRQIDAALSPGVVRAALETSARRALPGLADSCRRVAEQANASPEVVAFLGVIGGEQDVRLLANALATPSLAFAALRGLGALGLPSAVSVLLEALEDPRLMQEAGKAFLRITAADGVGSDRELDPPADLSEEEREFWDGRVGVDPARARAWWDAHRGEATSAGRWQTGLPVAGLELPAAFDRLTLEARRDVYLGCRLHAAARTPDLELEASAIEQVRNSRL